MLVICPFPQGVAAGQRLKYEQYFDDWRRHGWDIDVSSFFGMKTWRILYSRGQMFRKLAGTLRGHCRRMFDMFRVPQYDLVYVFMYVTPLGTSVFERLTRLLAKQLIFDVEDNVLLTDNPRNLGVVNPFAQLLKGPGKPRYLIQTADHVITSSPFLNEDCLKLNRRRAATYITSSVDTDRFLPATPYSNDRTVTIGWTGTFSSKPYLDLLRPVFQTLARRVDFKLMVIGNFDYELPGVPLSVIRWSAEREVEDLQQFDIGVYPLPLDDWVSGKSGLKAIQYMAFGLPTVATAVGTTPQIIRDGENGLLVHSEAEWIDALARLIGDPKLRRKLGEQARQDAVANYSVQTVAAQYQHILESVMETSE